MVPYLWISSKRELLLNMNADYSTSNLSTWNLSDTGLRLRRAQGSGTYVKGPQAFDSAARFCDARRNALIESTHEAAEKLASAL